MSPLLTPLRFKALCATLGLTLGAGLATLSQGCAGGACPTCGACASRLPILALPLVVDGALVLRQKLAEKKAENEPPQQD